MSEPLVINATVTLPAAELRWTAVRASGPGGQNVNKVASKVELRFDFTHSRALDYASKARLRTLAGSRLDAEGAIVVVSQVSRDRPKNLDDARRKLAELVRQALIAPKRRRPTRPSRAARNERITEKKKHGQKKRERRLPEE